MIEKIKNAVDKITTQIKTNKRAFTVTTAACLAVVAVTILVCTAVLRENRADNEAAQAGFRWGDGITEGIPAFSGEADNIEHSEKFAAAYYSNVTSEQVEEYIELVGSSCNLEFKGRQYPLSASFEDRIIAIHYNVTEMHFSVTVAQKD